MTLASFILFLIILSVILFFVKKWANGPLNKKKKDLTGKLIIITGASDGIGYETAKDLLNSNAKVIFACRNKKKVEEKINELPENSKKNAIFVQLDLSRFESVENFSKEIKSKYPKIDILINNAGIGEVDFKKTEDGYINTFQVNYLSNVLLTLLLLEHFNQNESKIISVSSFAYKIAKLTNGESKYLRDSDLMHELYSKIRRKRQIYADSKLLINYFTQYLGNLCEKKYPHLKVVCLHPGVIFTKIFTFENIFYEILFFIFRCIFYFFTKDRVYGAQNTLFLAYSDNKDLVNGGYYSNLKFEKYTPKGKDENLRKEMVNETLNILKNKYTELNYLPLCE